MAGSEPRLGITWMNMHTQSATNRRRSQEQERDLHAYNPGAGRPEFVQSQSVAPIASKKFGLVGANLSRANLGKADLSKADMRWAKLSRADLTEASLREADLSTNADLTGAKLRK